MRKRSLNQITGSVTLLPIYTLRGACAMMCAYRTRSTARVTWPTGLLLLTPHWMVRGLTCQPTKCGVGDMRRHSLMWEPCHITETRTRHLPATRSMRRKEPTSIDYMRWCTLHSHPLLPATGVWTLKQQISTKLIILIASLFTLMWDFP